ncbi:uncharacterized protein [Haliotis cracherodii]|uniref:uncharacterized protein n=1 Tax=Haliotis cracherodii TaxID=6455 RepID=UPI0039EA773D
MLLLLVISAACVAVGTADVTCPVLPCPFVGFCKKTIPTYYDHDGVRCRGCDQCSMDPEDAPVTQLPTIHAIQFHMCPMYMCMNPGQCSVPYTYSHFMVNGLNCTGCPSCPTGGHPDGSIILKKKQLQPTGGLVHINMCPMVMCKQPASCDVPYKTSTMHVAGRDCPGCPYCPTTTTA